MSKVFIIAEIGINHNGDISNAIELIRIAKDIGCDAVKFQKRTIDIVYSKEFLNSSHSSPWGKTQRDKKMALEFNEREYNEIDVYCQKHEIIWFASAWDIESLKLLASYNVKYNKVASPIIVNKKLLREIAAQNRYTFISTGMAELADIDCAVQIFRKYDCPFELMHCVSIYPTSAEDANLNCINTLRKRYNCKVGYSGHENDFIISIAATALGITSLERHLTLDKSMYGSDQAISLEPNEFSNMIKAVRIVEAALGNGLKHINEKEIPFAKKLRQNLKS